LIDNNSQIHKKLNPLLSMQSLYSSVSMYANTELIRTS